MSFTVSISFNYKFFILYQFNGLQCSDVQGYVAFGSRMKNFKGKTKKEKVSNPLYTYVCNMPR